MARTLASPRFLIRNFVSSLSFNGTTGKVQVANATNLQLSGSYTVTAWIKPITFGEGNLGRIISKNGGTNEYQWFISATNNTIAMQNGTATTLSSNANAITLNVWQHVAVTYNGTTITFYQNGVSVGSGSSGNPGSSTAVLLVGNQAADNRTFEGLIDEVSIYKGVNLSQTQIQQIYLNGTYPASNLSALWRFNEGSGSTANDSSGNGNTGTITTATYSTNVPSKPRTLATNRVKAVGRVLHP